MSVSPADFLQAAEAALAAAGEIDYRNAASRAYYGMYHACEHWSLELPDFVLPSENNMGMHRRFITAMLGHKGEGKATARRLGRILDNTYILRRKADYTIQGSFSLVEAKKAIDSSRIVLQELRIL